MGDTGKTVAAIRPKKNVIELKGQSYELKFDLNAMAELEDKYGSVEAAFTAMEAGKLKAIRAVLWVGMLADNPELTEHAVGAMIDMQDLASIANTLGKAAGQDMPTTTEVATTATNPN